MYETEDLLNYFKQDEAIIEQFKPCLIVSEFRFTALQLAKKLGIPSVGMTDATCHPHFEINGTVPDPLAKPNFLPLWFFDFIAQKTPLGKQMNRQIVQKISTSLREASATYGLEVLPTFFDYASQGDICLLCDHPDLIPIHPLRSGDIYTGALLWENPDSLPPELTKLNSNYKTVYISLGTQESLPTNFLDNYVEELLKKKLQVIISRGKRSFNLDIQQNDTLYLFDFLNDSKVLPLVDTMIYPGGAMTTYQALSCGVPLIALPAHANQHFYSEALAHNQLGCFFRPSRLKIDALVEKTFHLLNNSITRAAIKKFQQKIGSFNPRDAILKQIEDLLI